MSKQLFKVAFPAVTLPAHLGGRRAIVIMSFMPKDNPKVALATCIDIAGQIHHQVPFVTSVILEASRTALTFVEAPNERGPVVGASGLVGSNGRPL